MELITSEEALNTIAWVLFFGTPVIILLLAWIGITLTQIKNRLEKMMIWREK